MTDIKETRTLTLEARAQGAERGNRRGDPHLCRAGRHSPRRNLLVCLAVASNTLRIMANA